jgi:hypothetical protein
VKKYGRIALQAGSRDNLFPDFYVCYTGKRSRNDKYITIDLLIRISFINFLHAYLSVCDESDYG